MSYVVHSKSVSPARMKRSGMLYPGIYLSNSESSLSVSKGKEAGVSLVQEDVLCRAIQEIDMMDK